jgi:hypothetical protein
LSPSVRASLNIRMFPPHPFKYFFFFFFSIGTTARCGLWSVEQYPSIFTCHQLSPSSHS